LNVSADIVVVGLAITKRMSATLTGCEEALDDVDKS
jgi:hypothetical protein